MKLSFVLALSLVLSSLPAFADLSPSTALWGLSLQLRNLSQELTATPQIDPLKVCLEVGSIRSTLNQVYVAVGESAGASTSARTAFILVNDTSNLLSHMAENCRVNKMGAAAIISMRASQINILRAVNTAYYQLEPADWNRMLNNMIDAFRPDEVQAIRTRIKNTSEIGSLSPTEIE